MELDNDTNEKSQLRDFNYFAHIKNEEIITYYSRLLNSTMELIHYNYPEDWYEGDEAIMEHIKNCQSAIFTKLQIVLRNSKLIDGRSLPNDLILEKLQEKQDELIKLFAPIEEKYFEEVRVIDVNLWESVHDIDFDGHDWSENQNL